MYYISAFLRSLMHAAQFFDPLLNYVILSALLPFCTKKKIAFFGKASSAKKGLLLSKGANMQAAKELHTQRHLKLSLNGRCSEVAVCTTLLQNREKPRERMTNKK